uniref:Rhomboid domain-containing protein n=1 Tax=Syphacia muris TaxID=451379 RepID=A0A0N5ANY5_9BILA
YFFTILLKVTYCLLSYSRHFRPFFTYYVTSVQILVCIATLFFHGFEPIGFNRQERTASVLHTSVVLRQVSIYELENMWIGPKFSDLVRLGAKYSPCMRRDPQIYQQIDRERQLESETGCCIYNDGVGCFQASKNECPFCFALVFEFGVFGFSYCQEPLSTLPFVWSENISHWPICNRLSPNIPEDEKHLHCDITGRPCCILLHGQCRITTREYCDFVHGFYHPNATLCSQVSCLSEVCGMLPFLHKDHPDQFYRLFLSLFLHAGILHCVLTVLIHWYYMRDLEKLIGCGRLALLYMGSGIGGNLAKWCYQHFYLTMFTMIVFVAGVLPWIDNWAHIFGFIFGLLISLGNFFRTFPYFNFFGHSRKRRVVTVIGCWVSIIFLYLLFFLKFYKWPAVSWKWTEYINCIPFTDHMCDNQGVELKTWLNI